MTFITFMGLGGPPKLTQLTRPRNSDRAFVTKGISKTHLSSWITPSHIKYHLELKKDPKMRLQKESRNVIPSSLSCVLDTTLFGCPVWYLLIGNVHQIHWISGCLASIFRISALDTQRSGQTLANIRKPCLPSLACQPSYYWWLPQAFFVQPLLVCVGAATQLALICSWIKGYLWICALQKKICEANDSLKFQQWWLLGFFQQGDEYSSTAVPKVGVVNIHGTVIYFGKQQESLHMSVSFKRWRKNVMLCIFCLFTRKSLLIPHLFEPIQASIQPPNLQQTTPLSQPTVASISWSTSPKELGGEPKKGLV